MRWPKVDIAESVVRHRIWVFAVWIVAAAVLLPIANQAEERLDVAAHIEGGDSTSVTETLRNRFGSPFAHSAILVLTGVPAPNTSAGREVLRRVENVLGGVRGVTGTLSYGGTGDPLFLPHNGDGGTFVLVGLDSQDDTVEAMMPRLRAASTSLASLLRTTHPDATPRWTGEAAINADIRRVSAAEAQSAELNALPVTLLLMVLAFGSVTAAVLPILCGVLAIPVALGLAVIVDQWSPASIVLINIVTMIGLGLSIDYALLVVSRFREALGQGRTADQAAVVALRRAGRTVAISGIAVAIGFAALLVVPLNELRSIGIGGLLVVTTSVLLATTLLPALLAWIGTRIDLGRVGLRKARPPQCHNWRRWGRWVAAHPWRVLVVTGLPMLALAGQAARLDTELPRGDWLPAEAESVRAVRDLRSMGQSAVVQTIRVIVELPGNISMERDDGWRALARLSDAFARDPRVAAVRSIATLAEGGRMGPRSIDRLPEGVRNIFLSPDRRAGLVELIPGEEVAPPEATRLVREIRAMDAAALTGLRGVHLRVGGMPAFNAEYEDAIKGRLFGIVSLVVCATFLGLAIAFRSILIPLKAVALNLLSVAAAFGAVVLVFQDGHGVMLLGLDGPVGGGFPIIPILVFCTVFGLSMDYEVFLVARIAEARAKVDEETALVEGLANTGRVITSAAAIMIAVFAAFVLGDFVLIKILGFALAIAVLLDATLVRMAMGPALIRLAGRWNWWPRDGFQPGRRIGAERDGRAWTSHDIGGQP